MLEFPNRAADVCVQFDLEGLNFELGGIILLNTVWQFARVYIHFSIPPWRKGIGAINWSR